ncbi:MAG TPA: acetate uptake transporter [Ktedonobacteraceae bacterium]|nr:acetate uptake transporter [Ktedonobacteraceae bacterium]
MAQIAADSERTAPVAVATANPAPLGLSAFALTTFVLSAANAQLFPLADVTVLVGVAFFYGGLAQMLAGMWEFKAGNTFGATAFTSYGAFWIAVAAVVQFKLAGPGTAGFGWFLLGWTIFTGMMFLGTLRSNLALLGVFGFLFLAYLALTIGDLGSSTTWNIIGGWLGIITAIVAWYTALAGVLASVKAPFQLPTFPLG